MAQVARTETLGVTAALLVDRPPTALADVPATAALPPNTTFSVKTLIVGTTPVRVCVGGAELADRRTLRCQPHPLNESPIYLGKSNVDPAGDYFAILFPGGRTEEIDIGPALPVYAVAESAGQKLPIAELA